VSQFARPEGNFALLALMLLLTWTLAAFGEEFAFRGYLQARIRDVLPSGVTGLVIAVLVSSVLFGFIHTEQGVIGVVLTTLDGIFFSVLRYRYQRRRFLPTGSTTPLD
jgi:membrane protease YdiL (CAAX protease family)